MSDNNISTLSFSIVLIYVYNILQYDKQLAWVVLWVKNDQVRELIPGSLSRVKILSLHCYKIYFKVQSSI